MKTSCKKGISIFLVFAMMLSFLVYLPQTAHALTPEGFDSGSGTSADPWIVSTADQLALLSNFLGSIHADKYFKLGNDIDLNVAPYNTGTGWTPIAPTFAVPFTGHFDGNNKTIRNLYINLPTNLASGDYASLFGVTDGAEFKDLELNNVNVTGRKYVGALSGYGITATANSVFVIAGSVYGGSYEAGGLAGAFAGTVSDCGSTANVTAFYGLAGGLIGFLDESSAVSYCFSSGNVTATGQWDNGGLIGMTSGYSTITQSYATGNVTGGGDIGGLVGQNCGCAITNSYALGNVTASTNYAGSLVGVNNTNYGGGTVTNCYGKGLVTCPGVNVGGLVGNNDDASCIVTDSYYDSETTGQSDNDGRGVPLTSVELKAVISGWNFLGIWVQDPAKNSGYPYLPYTVTYNDNSSTGGSVPVDGNKYVWNETVTVQDNSSGLEKSGYVFSGWNTLADGSGEAYAANDNFNTRNRNKTLYAQWTLSSTYTVTYDGNGSTGGSLPPDGSYSQGDEVSVEGNLYGLVKTNYTFDSWNTAANGSGTTYNSGDTFTMGTSNVTLYAQWTALPTYTITYSDFGSDGGTAPVGGSYIGGASVTVSGNTGNLVKTGYTFYRWNTADDASGTDYPAGSTLTVPASNVTLYALWSRNEYTITYDGNGNTGGTVPLAQTNLYNEEIFLQTNLDLVKTGYTFSEWNTQADGLGTDYTGGTSLYIPAGDMTLYAKWVPNPVHVNYDGNGENGGTPPVDLTVYKIGDNVTALTNSGNLIKTGYTFAGWNTKADGTGTAYAAGASFTSPGVDVTLYAKWAPIPTYTITYDGNGNTGGAAPLDLNTYIAGDPAETQYNAPPFLVKTGYTFAGWNTAANGSGTSYAEGESFTMPSNNLTLYAKWIINSYTISYDTDGGSAVSSVNQNYNTTIATAPTSTKTGYTLDGWYLDSGFLTAAIFPYTITANATIYAKWTADGQTIVYDNNGGTGTMANTTGNTDASVTLTSNTFTKAGYTFTGWNTATNGGGTAYTDGQTITMPAGGLTLYAQWTAARQTIDYDSNGGTGTMSNTTGNTDTSVTLASNTFTKAGYTFSGWNTATNGGGTAYTDGQSLTMPAGGLTLYAQWTAASQTIVYNNNSGSGTMTSTTGNTDASVTLTSNTFSKAGYTFSGWNTATNGGGTAYSDGASITMPAGGLTLYAQWSAASQTIVYINNSGSGTMTSTTGNTDASVTLASNTFTKAGYTFSGWNTATNGGGTAYSDGASITMPAGGLTLYAQWTINQYTLTFDSNGGSAVTAITQNYNTTTISPVNPTQAGYTFSGWFTDSGLTTAASFPYTFTSNATFYAQWTADSQTIVYNNNSGTGTMANSTGNTDASVTLTSNTFTKAGYTFTGWNTATNGGGTAYSDGQTITMPAGGLTLYAQWTAASQTIAYDNNGGTGTMTNTTGNTDASVTLASNTFTKAGYTFSGWNTATNGGGTAYTDGASITMSAGGLTLYAQWTAASLTIVYDNNGGTGTMANTTGNTNASVTLTSNTFTKAGYTFSGWNTATNGGGTAYTDGQSLTMPAGGLTLYAQWTAASQTIAYDNNGGTGTMANSTGNTDASVTLTNNTFTKAGYNFTNWNTIAGGGGTAYTDGASITMPAGGLTLYAQWTLTPNIDSDGNGQADTNIDSDSDGTPDQNLDTNGDGTPDASLVYNTVTYDGNGNTAGTAPASTQVLKGFAGTVSANTGSLEKTSYTFTGWNTLANGSGDSYAAGVSIALTGSITLYAQWTETPDIDSDGNGQPDTNIDSDNDGTPDQNLDTDGDGVADTNLVYNTITYNGNGATGGSVPTATQVLKGFAETVSANTGSLEKTRYTFTGWNTLANGSGDSYAAGVSITLTGSVTLYAQWTATPDIDSDGNGQPDTNIDSDNDGTPDQNLDTDGDGVTDTNLVYNTITYNGNGATSGSVPTVTQVLKGFAGAVSANTGSLEKTSYTFAGWNTLANGTGTNYAAGATFSMNSTNVTLYAVWTNTYSVTGTVIDDVTSPPANVTGATVKVMQGNTQYGTTGMTDADGQFTITGVPNGTYNLVITKDTQIITLFVVWNGNYDFGSIVLPTGHKNSELNVTGSGTPDVVVDGLNELFDDTQAYGSADQTVVDNSGTVLIRLTVEKRTASAATGASEIQFLAVSQTIEMYLDMSLVKTVTDTSNSSTDTTLSTVGSLLKIIVPYDLSGKTDVTVYRYHGSAATAMTNLGSAYLNTTPPTEGYVLDSDNNQVIIWANNFSTYAIGYDTSGSSGGSTASSYTITAAAGTGGSISPSGTVSVTAGGSKTFTIVPEDDYIISDVLVDGTSVGAVSSYVFSNVTASHTITAVFVKGLPYYLDDNGKKVFIGFASDDSGTMKYIAPAGETVLFQENPKAFTDIASHWGKSYIDFVTEREIFVGTGRNTFAPDMGMTRAMFATVIGRLYERSYGTLTTTGAHAFTDCDYSSWYGSYIDWCSENGIIKGVGGGKFEPDRQVTRQEMAAMLYRFAKFLNVTPSVTGTLSYPDSAEIAGWAQEAALYCQETGIITGRDGGYFVPTGTATRAEVATIFQRFIELVV